MTHSLVAASPAGLWRALILFFLGTGVRYGEAAALIWNDLCLDGPSPFVRISRTVVPGTGERPAKTGRVRDVPLGAELVAILREFRHDRPYVFNPVADRLRDSLQKLSYRDTLATPVWSPNGHQEPISVNNSP